MSLGGPSESLIDGEARRRMKETRQRRQFIVWTILPLCGVMPRFRVEFLLKGTRRWGRYSNNERQETRLLVDLGWNERTAIVGREFRDPAVG